jgi:hypothetical protein
VPRSLAATLGVLRSAVHRGAMLLQKGSNPSALFLGQREESPHQWRKLVF